MHFSFQSNWFLILICSLGGGLALVLSYRQLRYGNIPRWRSLFMELLRVVIIVLIAFTLLRPEVVTVVRSKTDPEVVVLQDISGSMKTQDLVLLKNGSNYAVRRNEWVQSEIDSKFYSPLENKFKVSVESFAMPPELDKEKQSDGTDLAYALSEQLASYKNLRAVILLSDADWNYGASPVGAAAKLRANLTSVYAIATGSPGYLPDLVLQKVKAPAFCLAEEKISIPFQIQSRMNHEIITRVILSSDYGRENEKEIVIPPMDSYQDSIIWQPKKTGMYNLVLDLPVQDGELITDNNRFSFSINVKRELLKVLVIDSYPRWEYRYLRNALMRDPGVEVKTLLLHPGMSPGGGKNYIMKFPSKEEISQYDVIFLGDVGLGSNELTENDLKLIEGVVKHQGTGLVLLPGYRGRLQTLDKTVINDMNPVVLDKTRPEGISSGIPAKMELSSIGRKHFLMLLADSPTSNAYVWKRLPGFCWNAAVTKAKPGSHVLALHPGLRSGAGRMPLIVIREYGNGNVLFMGSDSAWKWRKGVEDKYHYRFWGQVVRWMAHKRHVAENKGIRCFFVPEAPQVGNTVYMYAAVHDRLNRPIDKATVQVNIHGEKSGKSLNFQLIQQQGEWGVYKGSFTTEESGKYQVSFECPQNGAKLDMNINVLGKTLEQIGQPVDMKAMNEIANITRGGVFMPENIDQVVSKINALPKQIEIEKRFLLWCQWWWGAILIGLLTIYWSLRKLFGLL